MYVPGLDLIWETELVCKKCDSKFVVSACLPDQPKTRGMIGFGMKLTDKCRSCDADAEWQPYEEIEKGNAHRVRPC